MSMSMYRLSTSWIAGTEVAGLLPVGVYVTTPQLCGWTVQLASVGVAQLNERGHRDGHGALCTPGRLQALHLVISANQMQRMASAKWTTA